MRLYHKYILLITLFVATNLVPCKSRQDTIRADDVYSFVHLYQDSTLIQDTTKKVAAHPVDTLTSKSDTLSYPLSQDLIDSLMTRYGDTLNITSLNQTELDSLINGMRAADIVKIPTKKELRKAERDSIRYIRDSVRMNTPRVLDTYIFPDSLYYRRMITWRNDTYFNKVELANPDTTFNEWHTEYPFLKKEYDVNASYLGVVGSAAQGYNYMKRDEFEDFPFFAPYIGYSYTPETIKYYNTKTPYTELAYWGTLFAWKDREEIDIKFLTTQNITPSLNVNLQYNQFGAAGVLSRERTNNKTFSLTFNNIGKRYLAHGGYIYQKVSRQENGGLIYPSEILDTNILSKNIAINLNNAENLLKRNTLYINQSYGVPLNILRKNSDSLSFDLSTMVYFGHSGEFSTYTKKYTDVLSSQTEKDFYNNTFYINPSSSKDSLRVMEFDNKFYLRIQPWANDAILSKIEGGIGYQLASLYGFDPDFFLSGAKNRTQNNAYFYAGASGNLKRYFKWEAVADYYFSGYKMHDFNLDANTTISIYPIDQGIHLKAAVHQSVKRPHWFENNLYTNHYKWSNDFNKVSKTKIEGTLDIPKYKLSAYFGYALVANNIYYDTLGIIRQHESPINIISAYLAKTFTLWKFKLDNKILFQMSSAQDVVPLPMLSLNLRYYLEFELVKNVLTAQIGAQALFNTSYYAPAYNPALGVFQVQNREEIGNTPYIDAFVNLQWKRASIFIKFVNAAQGWPNADYFSTYHYIRPQRALKFGIHWPFYAK